MGNDFQNRLRFVTTGIKKGFSTTIDVEIVGNIRFHFFHVAGRITCRVDPKSVVHGFLFVLTLGND
ncbi:MAG: hypothetical protein CMJ81_03530 [Planctomycetaceae bacterium]|nr:hypothetical protein [Planctomycetaceae bacterium]MBP63008.1 hypothetical protein [Planctomycetaceae bacterium]